MQTVPAPQNGVLPERGREIEKCRGGDEYFI